MNILFLGSRPPTWSAGLADSQIQNFIDRGHSVDFITGYYTENLPRNVYPAVQTNKKEYRKENNRINYYLKKPIELFRLIVKKIFRIYQYFPLAKEDEPIISPIDFVKAVPNKKYDFAVVGFMEDVISSTTLEAIYQKIKCPIFIFAVDMQPMTGGCLYFWNCMNYRRECVDCPVLILRDKKTRLQAHNNYLIKQKIYNTIDAYIFCNDWMKKKIIESSVFSEDRVKKLACNINTHLFSPIADVNKTKLELGLPLDRFIIFAGSSDLTNPRKGTKLMIKSINHLAKNIDNINDVLLVIAGNNTDKIVENVKIDVHQCGFLSPNVLAKMYAVSDLFISPTIEDAGPSMVNQSLACGTPVVAYEVGVACELIKIRETGYLAKHFDYKDFAHGIKLMYSLSSEERAKMRHICRKRQVDYLTKYSSAQYIEQVYSEINKNL